MAAVRFTYTGAGGEIIPQNATHVFVDAKTIPVRAFRRHQNLIEVICHKKVIKVEEWAFDNCPRLRRVIMPGVKIAGYRAFYYCTALMYVECGKLEKIGAAAFFGCKSLRSIDLPSAEIVELEAFQYCTALASAKFSNKMGRLDQRAFSGCTSLERITIPLKDGITYENIFMRCTNLNHVDLVEGTELRETITALNMEWWRNDMNEELDSIKQTLPNAPAGGFNDTGEKALVIRLWIRTVLGKIFHYKAEHQRVLDEAATTLLQLGQPHDIVMKNILSFLELPPHMFG